LKKYKVCRRAVTNILIIDNRNAGCLALFAIQCRVEALFNEALLDVIDCVDVTMKLFRNIFIAVFGFTVGSINCKQDVGVFHFIGVMFAFGDNIMQ
jgi:hypothetical protein